MPRDHSVHHHHHHHEDGFTAWHSQGWGLQDQPSQASGSFDHPQHEPNAGLLPIAAAGGQASLDTLLFDYLVQSASGGHAGQLPAIIIDHLDLFNTTQTNTSQVFLNAANGGTIDVGGNVNALASQQAVIDHSVPPVDTHLA